MADVDFNYFLARKYAALQQQADATTKNAESGAVQADAQALTAKADANLTGVRAKLLPGESAAQTALQRAQAALTGQQTEFYGPEAIARIGGITANTALTNTQNKSLFRDSLVDVRDGVTPLKVPDSILGTSPVIAGYKGFRLSADPTLEKGVRVFRGG
jgi:hypothetical protein